MRANKGRSFGSCLVSLMLVGLAACCCPKPVTPAELTPDEQVQVSAAREYLAAAETKGTWDSQDDAKFSATIAKLPPAAHLALGADLVRRLNSEKLRPIHPRPEPGQVVCPGLCDSGVKKDGTPLVPRTPGKPAVKQDVKPDVKQDVK